MNSGGKVGGTESSTVRYPGTKTAHLELFPTQGDLPKTIGSNRLPPSIAHPIASSVKEFNSALCDLVTLQDCNFATLQHHNTATCC